MCFLLLFTFLNIFNFFFGIFDIHSDDKKTTTTFSTNLMNTKMTRPSSKSAMRCKNIPKKKQIRKKRFYGNQFKVIIRDYFSEKYVEQKEEEKKSFKQFCGTFILWKYFNWLSFALSDENIINSILFNIYFRIHKYI